MNMHNIPSGTVTSVQRGPFQHVGILAEPDTIGCRTVISGSFQHGRVVEEPLNEFADGKTPIVVGYPGALPGWRVLQRARAVIGSKYRLTRISHQ